MPYLDYSLPDYPCHADMWDELKNEKRPIMVYGMGNGADKLFLRFEKYGISVEQIFASDGFVRGHSFRGMKVRSFSEIINEYRDFVIVVSFASSRSEVLEIFQNIDEKYDVYFPDMPIAGDEYFDKDFYNANYDKILTAKNSLHDEESIACFDSLINYKISGKLKYLLSAYSEKRDIYSLLGPDGVRHVVDVGAYNGDTLMEAVEFFPNLTTAICIEPDTRNYKKLTEKSLNIEGVSVKVYNAAAWSENGEGEFSSSANRNSTLLATASFQHKTVKVPKIRVDSTTDRADYVKYDVEGAEIEVLRGTEGLIDACHPSLLVSAYHRSRDIFELINYLSVKYPCYRLFLRRTLCVPAWEINLIAVKE